MQVMLNLALTIVYENITSLLPVFQLHQFMHLHKAAAMPGFAPWAP